jgi:hypothetical protein
MKNMNGKMIAIMKKIYRTFICALATITLMACAKEESPRNHETEQNPTLELEKVTFTAVTSDTKISLGADNISVSWNADDKIAVFDGSQRCEFVTKQGGSEAIFEGSVKSTATDFYAFYPYSSALSLTDGKITATVPAVQSGAFADHMTIAYTGSEERELAFKNVTAVVKFTLDEDYVTKVTFRGKNNEIIAGDIAVLWNEGNPVVEVTNGISEITIGDGSNVLEKKDYYLIVAPNNLEAGFTMTLTYKEDPSSFYWQWGQQKGVKGTYGVTSINKVGEKPANLISGKLLDLGKVNMSIVIYDEGWNENGVLYSYTGGSGFCNEVTANPYSGTKCLEISMSSRYGFVGIECVADENGTLDLSAAYDAGFCIEFAVRTTTDIKSNMYVSIQQKATNYNPGDWRAVNSSNWNGDGSWQIVRLPLRSFWAWERGWLTNNTKISDLAGTAKNSPFRWDKVQRVGFEPCGHSSWNPTAALNKTFYIDAIRICKYIAE